MRSHDWQRFEDGSLDRESTRAAREAIATDPAAKAEYAGFTAFRDAVREEGHKEAVPLGRLQAALSDVVREKPKRVLFSPVRVLAPVAAILAIFFIALWWKHDPMEFAVTPTAKLTDVFEEKEAAQWVHENAGFAVPTLRLPHEATLVAARVGEDRKWACLDFVQNGQTFYLYVNRDGEQLSHGERKVFDGRTFYDGKGVGWKTANLAYYLKGGTHGERWSLAGMLAPQTTL